MEVEVVEGTTKGEWGLDLLPGDIVTMALLGMVLNFKASRIATLCGLGGPRTGWVGAVCRCRAQGRGRGKGEYSVCREFKNSKKTNRILLSCVDSSRHCGDKYPSLLGQPVRAIPAPWSTASAVSWGAAEEGTPEGARAGEKPRFLHLVNERLLRTELETHEPGQGRDKKILRRRQLSRG